MGLLQHFNWASVITCKLTVRMQNHPQLVGDDRDRVQNFQVGLLRHVVGDPLRVVGDPLLNRWSGKTLSFKKIRL